MWGIHTIVLNRYFRYWNFCFWVPFLEQLLLRNCAVDFVEMCNVYVGKMIIKATKMIFNSDKTCHSYSDLNFGVTFSGTQCRSKTANVKRWYHFAAHCQNVSMLQSNMIFCDICCFSSEVNVNFSPIKICPQVTVFGGKWGSKCKILFFGPSKAQPWVIWHHLTYWSSRSVQRAWLYTVYGIARTQMN